ncbi:MAG: hypothetical protein JO257_07485 [Deltaproteobacteria bacterium]|nr:hypothetical protein [Deltaproteobacteria bacterium]
MSTNKNLAKKRAQKAAKRRAHKNASRTRAPAAGQARTSPTRAVFPQPETFAIDANSIADLQKLIVAAGPSSVLSLLALEILFGGDDPSRVWLSVEHATWLALVSPDAWPRDRFADPLKYGEICKRVEDHLVNTRGRLMAERMHATGPDLQLQHLLIDATLQHLDVRKLVFRFQAREEAAALFASVSAEMRAHVGFDIAELLRVEEAIESLVVARGDAWWARKHDFLTRLRTVLDGGTPNLKPNEAGWLAEARELLDDVDDVQLWVMMQWSLASAAEAVLLSAKDVSEAAGLEEAVVRAALRQYSLRPPQPVIAESLPSLYEPLELKPLVQVDDDHWLCHLAPPKLSAALRPNLEKELKPTAVWQRYQQGRAAYLETTTVDLLKSLSPHSQGWVGLKYTFDDGQGRQEFELDGLVLIDGIAFLVEGKAGAVRLASRRGQPGTTIQNLKDLAVDAHDQALRAKRYITQASPEAEFRVGAQRVRIARVQIREFILVTTTLEVLSAFLTRTYDLVQTGLLTVGQLPWAVALPELQIICDLSAGAGDAVHYIHRRLDLGRRDISASEELDWFGNYLQEGLFFDDEDYAKYDRIQLGDFAGPINAYYEALHDPRLPSAPKPRQTVPDDIAALIRDLERYGPPGFVDAVTALLDGNGAARKRLDQGIREAKATARRKHFGGFRMKMANVVVVVSFHEDEPKRDNLARYVRAAKYKARAGRAVGIAQSANTPAQIAIVIEEGPFIASSAGELESEAFFASLKTREEKA